MCPPRTDTISPLRIGFAANRPRPWVSLVRTSVFGERYDAAIFCRNRLCLILLLFSIASFFTILPESNYRRLAAYPFLCQS